MSLTPAERTCRARLAAYSMHARGSTNTGPARAAFEAKFLDLVDKDRVLPEPIRLKRAAAARKAYYAKLAFRSVKARAARRAA